MIKQTAGLVPGLIRTLKLIIFKSLKIQHIKNADIYFLGWLYSLVNVIIAVLSAAAGNWLEAAIMSACGISSAAALVIIGQALGEKTAQKNEILDIRLALNPASARRLAGLLRQGLLYAAPDAIQLSDEGIHAVREIADNIETLARTAEQAKEET